jgi:hypothetical protein
MAPSMDRRGVVVLIVALAFVACGGPSGPPAAETAPPAPAATAAAPAQAPPAAPPSTAAQPDAADALVLADFDTRVKEYTALHKKLESTLPTLSKESSPEQIDKHQRALARLVQQARTGVKPGTIFTPGIEVVVRRLMAQVFGGTGGAALKASIMDENPGPLKLAVNGRYPDTVPFSTVPPQVLQGLPTLPAELEFRFIGRHLILMDEHAHLIVDLVQNVLPR